MGRIQIFWAFDRQLRIFSVQGQVEVHSVSSLAKATQTCRKSALHMWDFTDGALDFGSQEGNRKLCSGLRWTDPNPSIRTALVCPNELDHGLFRLVHAFAPFNHYPRQLRAFRCLRAANRWLGVCKLCRSMPLSSPPNLRCFQQCTR